MNRRIPLELKRRCVEAMQTMEKPEIYRTIFHPEHPQMSYECFRHRIKEWKKHKQADTETLESGTYPDFTATHATVQVNGEGEIVQAWIKQGTDEEAAQKRYDSLIETIRNTAEALQEHFEFVPEEATDERMLEINLCDMHFGLPNQYGFVACQLVGILYSKYYEEIDIVLGQDLFHNNDLRGKTAKGTPIEQVDIAKAWDDALRFWSHIIRTAQKRCSRLKIIYVKGNHDECLAWAFVQLLKGLFPDVEVDDSLDKRKCIFWRKCFVGLTHGDENGATPQKLRGMFTIQFPMQFAASEVREVHASHLHHEDGKDEYGVMTRRLSTANVTDKWSDDGGYIGAHKRFMCFEYSPGRLSSIYYLNRE